MKVFAAITLLSAVAHAFPTAENIGKLMQRSTPEEIAEALTLLQTKRSAVDALSTPISVTGDHAFQPPNFTNGDIRGSCPGLNALANHGYLSRTGVVNFMDFIVGSNAVYGLGIDITTVLAVMSSTVAGNLVSFSLGGQTTKVTSLLGLLGSLLGTPQGIDHTHNLIESDGSSTRDDIYMTGDSWTMNMTKFMEVYNSIDPNGGMTFDDMGQRSANRWNQSVANNPYFYYGPWSGMFGRSGGYLFATRLMSNHSVDHPRGGYLTRDVLCSQWGVYNISGTLTYKVGWEQIPANWYRIQGDYNIPDILADILNWGTQHPQLLSIGGNVGSVNSFVGVDWINLTGGVFDAGSILQGNNLACFVLQVLKTGSPTMLSSLYSTVATPLALLNNAIATPMLNLSCPVFGDLKMGGTDLLSALQAKYPGAKKAASAL